MVPTHPMLQRMGGGPRTPAASTPQTRFSADGFWWWDGAEWRAALSHDRLWRWNGQAWEPAQLAPRPRGGAGVAVGITVAIFLGVVLFVSLFTVLILYTMGTQISNVFSNSMMS